MLLSVEVNRQVAVSTKRQTAAVPRCGVRRKIKTPKSNLPNIILQSYLLNHTLKKDYNKLVQVLTHILKKTKTKNKNKKKTSKPINKCSLRTLHIGPLCLPFTLLIRLPLLYVCLTSLPHFPSQPKLHITHKSFFIFFVHHFLVCSCA